MPRLHQRNKLRATSCSDEQLVTGNKQHSAHRVACYPQQVACCAQLVASSNMLRTTRNLLRATSNKLRATCCRWPGITGITVRQRGLRLVTQRRKSPGNVKSINSYIHWSSVHNHHSWSSERKTVLRLDWLSLGTPCQLQEVVTSSNVKEFEARLDKTWKNQPMKFDWVRWKCKTWKNTTWNWRTKITGHDFAGHEIDRPNRRTWNCRTRRKLKIVHLFIVIIIFQCRLAWSLSVSDLPL